MSEDIQYFIDHVTFDRLMTWITTMSIGDLILNPFVLVPVLVIVGLISYPKTTGLGQMLMMYVPAILYLGLTAAVLRNDSITNTGPFIMAILAFFMIVGWFVWTKLLGD
ncbi:MAG: hypothetical protein HZB29_04350 [Nitrospinae bacterium]|nr:hypothetical protein [Nitrospinota bacterium]